MTAPENAASPSVDNTVTLGISRVSKTFHTPNGPVRAVNDLSLQILRGEFISLLGPSGCGKTTLLRMVAGLETDYEGSITMDGEEIKHPGLDRGIIFQEHRLLPWLTVGDNVGLGLDGPKKHINDRVDIYLKKVGLSEFGRAYPKQLSGGMSQRAAIARALICQPKIFLLDEPFGALDAMTRVQMQEEIERIYMSERNTMVLVTHDIEEAIFLSDRIVVMTSRPARINTIIPVRLQRSRDRNSQEFVDIRRQILGIFTGRGDVYSI